MGLQKGYEAEFNEALARTKQWDLAVPPFTASEQPAINDVTFEKFRMAVQNVLIKYQPEEISLQCFQITGLMQKPLEEVFNVPLTLTLGYVDLEHKSIFYTPIDELKELMTSPPYFEDMKLHAWLTTPNYEIIDLTIGTTYSMIKNDPEPLGMLFCQHHSQFNDSMVYHPQIVGEDYLFKTAGIAEFFLIS